MNVKTLLVITVGLLFLQATNLQAQSFRLKEYKMTVKGTSSLHDWESEVEKVECKGFYTLEEDQLADVKNVVVKIPVTSIKSTKGKMMDNKTYDAFNYEKHPYIIFTLNTKKISKENSTIDLKGVLAMAGTSKPIDVELNYKILPNGELKITGSKNLRMTNFKMEPPTAMMGTIKVGDEVVITFDMTLTTSNSNL
jgi:hypothetical protein